MRGHLCRNYWGGGSALVALLLATLAVVASGCGTQDWQRDLLSGVLGAAPGPVLPIPGPAGPAGADGAAGAPGPTIIIARAVVNADATLANSDDITVAHPSAGVYELTVDVTGDTLPAGATEDSFEVLITLKETTQAVHVVYYVPVSLVGTTLRIDVMVSNAASNTDHGFSVQVLLPAG